MFIELGRREYNGQIVRAYVLTLLGVFTSVLLWFWLVAPLGSPDVWPLLELPTSGTGRKAPATERDLFISVRQNGDLFLNQQPISKEDLTKHLHDISIDARHASPQLFVRVDRATPFGSVRPILRASQLTGQTHLVFLAKPRTGSSFAPSQPELLPPPREDALRRRAPSGCPDISFFEPGGEITPPRVVSRISPELPFAIRRMRFSGSALLEVFITAAGEVCAVRVIRGIDPALDATFIKAIQQSRFSPAQRLGSPVPCILLVTVNIHV